MLCWQHTRTGMTQYAVCGALALCVISLVVLVPVRLAAAAPRAQASSDCSASITVQLAGVRQTANGIVTRKVSCAAARTVLRSFLQRADRQPSCRSAALQPPPTSGCLVSGYHCFLRVAVNYCATPSGREFGWTLRVRRPNARSRAATGRLSKGSPQGGWFARPLRRQSGRGSTSRRSRPFKPRGGSGRRLAAASCAATLQ